MKKITWNDVELLCQNLEQKIRECGTVFTAIYGEPRGGLPAAVILSHKLNIPMCMSYDDISRKMKRGENVLIVDDINDTGKTLRIWATWERATLIVLYERESSALRCDLVGEKITSDEWLLFPWENEERVKEDKREYELRRVDLNQLFGE